MKNSLVIGKESKTRKYIHQHYHKCCCPKKKVHLKMNYEEINISK